MDLRSLGDALGKQVAFGVSPVPQSDWSCGAACQINYGVTCTDYLCTGLFECNVFGCSEFQCGTTNPLFSCANTGGGNDFTCPVDYSQSPSCGSPVPSIPCPGT